MAIAKPLKTSDGRFAYEAAGTPGGTPLVFLHGIGGAARAWRHQLNFFGDRYYAIAWDMPGYGGSAPLTSVSIATLAGALNQFLGEFNSSAKPVLVGHSIGGMIVQQWLWDNPVAAQAAVLAQTSPAFGKPDGDWQKSFIDARLGPLDRGQTLASLARSLVSELIGDHPDPAGIDLAHDCMASVPDATYRATVRALIGFDLRHALKKIVIPTLVLSGSKDNNAPAPMMAKTATYVPSSTYVEIEGAGHLVNLEQPDKFNAALDGFLSTIGMAERKSA
ncbi:alpha/beta fold hydrolase [Bradyrhizobium archetypum]|uniref:Alpha/beta fold hydrolase n=1 Tax=Bradyrhizobium archetypum TaxID=2721160 RepID=A0A7Y4H5J8_9BRAD|nr:alpha/beta fold hydrolase [Bradyrhizobium archetypum]NOJ47647.1 alpha/beta fold hydrolase [Bradyrhizobium archetypum]